MSKTINRPNNSSCITFAVILIRNAPVNVVTEYKNNHTREIQPKRETYMTYCYARCTLGNVFMIVQHHKARLLNAQAAPGMMVCGTASQKTINKGQDVIYLVFVVDWSWNYELESGLVESRH